jgi:hypothetical protein
MPTSLIIFGKSVWSLGVPPLLKSIKGGGTTPNDSNRIMNQGCLGGENRLMFGVLKQVLNQNNKYLNSPLKTFSSLSVIVVSEFGWAG